jgi:hypothetical protein
LSLLLALGGACPAQTIAPILQIAQTGIGSNGFGTTWRGQDVQLEEDAWLFSIVFQAGSAASRIDEVRLMTAVPNPVTIHSSTVILVNGADAEAILPAPYMLRGGTRYTVWFHQTGSPNGTYGCDLHLVDPSWGGYHTNVDPTVAPGPGEPSYFWAYQYGTNVRLMGYDNLEITGNVVPGGAAVITLEAPAFDFAFVAFGLQLADQQRPNYIGPLRLDPAWIPPAYYFGVVDAAGLFVNTLPIPNLAWLHGTTLFVQGAYDPSFAWGATLSPMEVLTIL